MKNSLNNIVIILPLFLILVANVSANQPDLEIPCIESADVVLSSGQYAICAFEEKGDMDFVYFHAQKGDSVEVTLLRTNVMTGISFQVYSPNNVQVAMKRSYQPGIVSFKAPESGQYRVEAIGNYIEPYTIQVNSPASTQNENPLGFELHKNSSNFKNDYDFFKFYAEANTSIRLDISNLTRNSGLIAKVFNAEGTEISSISDYKATDFSEINFNRSGVYFVRLVSNDQVEYSLQLTCTSGSCPDYQEPQPFTMDFSDGMRYCLEDLSRCNTYFGF